MRKKASKSVDPIEVNFTFEKETPGTYRFQEDGEKEEQMVGTLYVKKRAFGKAPPESITVTITVE